MAALRHGDLLVLTSDHGCDPTTPSTDHSREHGLLLAHLVGAPRASGRHDGDTFADVGATVQRHLTGAFDADLPGTPVL
jgi:phosphopentomutase